MELEAESQAMLLQAKDTGDGQKTPRQLGEQGALEDPTCQHLDLELLAPEGERVGVWCVSCLVVVLC